MPSNGAESCLLFWLVPQLQELSQAEAVDGGLADLLSRAAEASIVLGDGGLQADVEFDRLAAAGGGRQTCLVLAARQPAGSAASLQCVEIFSLETGKAAYECKLSVCVCAIGMGRWNVAASQRTASDVAQFSRCVFQVL